MPGPSKSKQLSEEDFAAYGCSQLAYVKRIDADGIVAYAAHAADGSYLSHFADYADACFALRQHDLDPLSLH